MTWFNSQPPKSGQGLPDLDALEYLDGGIYSEAYRDADDVYIYTLGIDLNKWACSMISQEDAPHLPHIRQHKTLIDQDGKYWELWTAPYYAKLEPSHRQAWEDYMNLRYYWNRTVEGFYPIDKFWPWLERLEGNVTPTLWDSLFHLIDMCLSMNNNWALDMKDGNLAVDEQGRLILLDILFDASNKAASAAKYCYAEYTLTASGCLVPVR